MEPPVSFHKPNMPSIVNSRSPRMRRNFLRGKVGENLFVIESGVFGYGAERMHYGGDFKMHPKRKKRGRKRKKPKKTKGFGKLLTAREFKEGEITDVKTGESQLSRLQRTMDATVVHKAVWF